MRKRDLIIRIGTAGIITWFMFREFGLPGAILSFASFATLSLTWIVAKRIEAPNHNGL